MEVLGFQVFFFLLILISGLFGRKTRNFVVIASLIFTVIMVFMTWLIILQFVTITVSYFITENYVESSKKKLHNIDESYGSGCISLIVGGGIILIVLKLCSDNYKEIEVAKKRENKVSDSIKIADDSIKAFSIDTLSSYYPNNSNHTQLFADTLESTQFNTSIYDDELSKRQIIKDFISAENSRDFVLMNVYLANQMEKFWNIENPNNYQIAKRYNLTWSNYLYTNTNIIEITKIASNYFLVKVKYEFDDKIKINEITFIFDEDEKIKIIE